MEESADSRKRGRNDSDELEPSSPDSKRVHSDAYPDPNKSESGRVHTDPISKEAEIEANSAELNLADTEFEFDSAEAKEIPEDILDILDDVEAVPAIQDLDSVIRSFEEEILQASPSPAQPVFMELTSHSGESQPDLGYLLEASDDELGLPPTLSSTEDQAQNEPINTPAENGEVLVGLGSFDGFEEELHNYDAFELGLGESGVEGESYAGNNNGDFVTVDGLFDYSEPCEFSDFTWRPESLPAS